MFRDADTELENELVPLFSRGLCDLDRVGVGEPLPDRLFGLADLLRVSGSFSVSGFVSGPGDADRDRERDLDREPERDLAGLWL